MARLPSSLTSPLPWHTEKLWNKILAVWRMNRSQSVSCDVHRARVITWFISLNRALFMLRSQDTSQLLKWSWANICSHTVQVAMWGTGKKKDWAKLKDGSRGRTRIQDLSQITVLGVTSRLGRAWRFHGQEDSWSNKTEALIPQLAVSCLQTCCPLGIC